MTYIRSELAPSGSLLTGPTVIYEDEAGKRWRVTEKDWQEMQYQRMAESEA